MATKKCMKCGGTITKKMKDGGMATKVLGPAKKPFAAGIPYFTGAGQTGPESMKKGGATKTPKAKFGSSVPVKHNPPKGMRHDSEHKGYESVAKAKKGGTLKTVPADKVGLAKLPTAVRNKMGYKQKGGSVKKK